MATYSERLAANADIGVAAVAALVLFASCSHDRDRIEPDGGTIDPCPKCDASDAVEERLDSREADAESTDSRPLEFTNQDVDVADSKPVEFNNQDADAALDALTIGDVDGRDALKDGHADNVSSNLDASVLDEASDTSDTGQSDVADASFECNAVDVDRPDGSPVCNGTVPVHLEGLCAWFTDGHAKCWSAEFLQHVDGGAEDASTSKDIPLSGVIELVMGHGHACALLQDHTVWCWGRNDSGQLGDGTRVEHSTPEPVPGLTNVVQIVASSESTCARIDDGTLRCWGGDDYGQLGDGVWRPYVEMAGTSHPPNPH